MIERRLRTLWEHLQGKKPRLPHFLTEIHLQGIRGIDDLRVVFDYPVSVIAGGKSTVLFTAACAYLSPDAQQPVRSAPNRCCRFGMRRSLRCPAAARIRCSPCHNEGGHD